MLRPHEEVDPPAGVLGLSGLLAKALGLLPVGDGPRICDPGICDPGICDSICELHRAIPLWPQNSVAVGKFRRSARL